MDNRKLDPETFASAMRLVEKAISRTQLACGANKNLDFVRTLRHVLDNEAAGRVTAMYQDGAVTFEKAVYLVGSSARVDWAFSMYSKNKVPKTEFYRMLPYIWGTGVDIEDVKPLYLEVWRKAWLANGHTTIDDGKPLTATGTMIVYRGHRKDHPTQGCNWHLQVTDAQLAALGHLKDECPKTMVVGMVEPKHVYGYLTKYADHKVIVDPAKIRLLPASVIEARRTIVRPA